MQISVEPETIHNEADITSRAKRMNDVLIIKKRGYMDRSQFVMMVKGIDQNFVLDTVTEQVKGQKARADKGKCMGHLKIL